MGSKEVVEKYLDVFFGGPMDFIKIEVLLTENFQFQGPLMTADGSREFINKLKSFGDAPQMKAQIHDIIVNGNVVAAIYDFITPDGKVPASEWYWVEEQKISRMQLFCDPRPFLQNLKG